MAVEADLIAGEFDCLGKSTITHDHHSQQIYLYLKGSRYKDEIPYVSSHVPEIPLAISWSFPTCVGNCDESRPNRELQQEVGFLRGICQCSGVGGRRGRGRGRERRRGWTFSFFFLSLFVKKKKDMGWKVVIQECERGVRYILVSYR